MRKNVFPLTIIGLFCILTNACKHEEIMDQEVDKLLSQLTLEEKVSLIHGDTYFTTPAIPRLGIPALHLSDGPCGVREEIKPHSWGALNLGNDFSGYFPSLTALASTWNPDLAVEFGIAYSEEAIARGKEIMLTPGINIHRTPLNGRNWEYLSEDPFLTSRLAVDFIKAAQSQGVAVCAKHYALNNQEFERGTINVEASERALREIYLPAFEAAVKEGEVLSVMGAYNKFRGQHCCHNAYLINDILKGEWKFPGLVMSDWGGTHSTLEAANNGLDLEMLPINGEQGKYFLGQPLLDSIKEGKIDPKVVDEKVRRILYVMVKLNIIGKSEDDTIGMVHKLATPEHANVALKIAEESIILLKNEQLLPLNFKSVKTLAVIGDNATRKHAYGGWSTEIKAKYEITPLEGLQKRLGDSVKINYVQGYKVSKDLNETDQKLINEAVDAASKADAVIFFGGLNHEKNLDCEGSDKLDMKLPYGQDQLIKAVTRANPKTLIVLITGTPVEMSEWIGDVKGLLYTSYIGMETGTALAKIIAGDVNPSGKLTYTIPVKLEDTPVSVYGDYPGKNGTVQYNEDIFVGYRYYDTKKVDTQFPFGFGLSYTTFKYSDLSVITKVLNNKFNCQVSFKLNNSGNKAGKEIAQIYVKDTESRLIRPLKELKGFAKVDVKPGEFKTVEVNLDERAFQYYDPENKRWILEPGKFEIMVGPSVDNIILSQHIEI